MSSISSRVVVLLHGIRTRGVWQKKVTPALSAAGFIPYPLDYGRFGTPSLLNRWKRARTVEWLHHELDHLRREARAEKVSVIAHSFGTYMLGAVLEKYRQHRFDKLILLGSILDRAYRWKEKLEDWRVGFVHNEYGTQDEWPRRAARVVRDAGDSGSLGFLEEHPRLHNEKHAYGHSDYFTLGHCTSFWLPVLRRHLPEPRCVSRVQDLLSVAVQDVASALRIDPGTTRANVFVEQEPGRLSIPEGFHFNMNESREVQIQIELGHGVSGRAYKLGRQVVTVLRQGAGPYALPRNQLRLVHPELKWVVSTPINDPDSRWGFSGVVNVDSIGDDKSEDELRPALVQMVIHAGGLGKLFKGISRIADSVES